MPSHRIHFQAKAKNYRLRFCKFSKQLEIRVPFRTSERRIIQFLLEHQDWILSHQPNHQDQKLSEIPPRHIELKAIGRSVEVFYQDTLPSLPPREALYLPFEQDQVELILPWLKNWLKEQAFQHFSPWLHALSLQTKLPYHSLQISISRTRWGSYANNQKVMLNACLLFFPPELVDYVIIHELCHSVFFDHSSAFWNLVEQHYCAWRLARKKCKQIQDKIPLWPTIKPSEMAILQLESAR